MRAAHSNSLPSIGYSPRRTPDGLGHRRPSESDIVVKACAGPMSPTQVGVRQIGSFLPFLDLGLKTLVVARLYIESFC